MRTNHSSLPRVFVMKRLHSLLGLWIVLFLIEHFLTNSQAALLIGERGAGFIRAVNFIKNLPYLPLIEVILIGVPIAYHMIWGLSYLFTAKMNAWPGKGNRPSLTRFGRNNAYSLQRITSWILLVGIVAHVGYMRFYRYPVSIDLGKETLYFVKVSMDPGLYTVANRLEVPLYDEKKVASLREAVRKNIIDLESLSDDVASILNAPSSLPYLEKANASILHNQNLKNQEGYLRGLEAKPLSQKEVIAVASDFGTATLLMVRDTFKYPFHAILYTIFVLAAAFHAFNGLWTFLITWGIVIRMRAQSRAVNLCMALMALMAFLGLAAIWGTYYLTLRN